MTKIFSNKSIGVFDSGFGGINILRGIVKALPEYDYVYLGDNARTPYGSRSQEVVYGFTKQAVDFLFSKNCELIVIACNTASSEALRKIQREYLPAKYPDRKVLGVLVPGAEAAVSKTRNGKIGVMATESTVSSGSFEREIRKLDPSSMIFQEACPLLVPIIEFGEYDSEAAEIILKRYLKPLEKNGIDTLILGCTHYGILENRIKKIMGKKVRVISGAKVVAKKLRDYLERHNEIERELSRNGSLEFYSTDLTDRFVILGSKYFGRRIKAEKIILGSV